MADSKILVIFASLALAAVILVPRTVYRSYTVHPMLTYQQKRLNGAVTSTKLLSEVCGLAAGSWCVDWTQLSKRRRKLAHTQGIAPIEAYNKTCLWDCNGVGVCDHTTGRCRCQAGWQGESCQERQDRPCSQHTRTRGSFKPEDTPFEYNGVWKASMCAGDCDLDFGSCFCPKWTKFGRTADPDQRKEPTRVGRPMGLHCQPSTDETGSAVPNGDVPYDDLFGPDGWCQAAKPVTKCSCSESGDGLSGDHCENTVRHMCPGQFNGDRGECRQGFLRCDDGWTGTDCSIQLNKLVTADSIQWSAQSESRSTTRTTATKTAKTSTVALKAHRDRPLIYVYDMPVDLTTRMLEYKLGAGTCVHRVFDEDGSTIWNSKEYSIEVGLHELLLESPHRTLDPEEADFFYVPVYVTCYINPVHSYADRPWFHQSPTSQSRRVVGAANMLVEAFHWVSTVHPYWNRKGGRDHILLNAHDEGSCWVPEVWRPAIILSHWGSEEVPRRRYTSYESDKFDIEYTDDIYHPELFSSTLGQRNMPCVDRDKDILVPSMVLYPHKFPHSPWLTGKTQERDILGLHVGRTLERLPEFSNGTRQAMTKICREDGWWERHRIYVGEARDVPSELSGHSYSEMLARSTWCFVLMGEGFTTRFEDAIAHQCIPVILIDNILMPFEPQLTVESFSIRIATDEMHRVPEILAEHEDKVELYRRRIAKIASRYEWRFDRFKASAREPKIPNGENVKDDRPMDAPDAFETLLGVLHGRLDG